MDRELSRDTGRPLSHYVRDGIAQYRTDGCGTETFDDG